MIQLSPHDQTLTWKLCPATSGHGFICGVIPPRSPPASWGGLEGSTFCHFPGMFAPEKALSLTLTSSRRPSVSMQRNQFLWKRKQLALICPVYLSGINHSTVADSELPVVLQPCNSWKVHCVSDSPAGLGSLGPARARLLHWPYRLLERWSHRVGGNNSGEVSKLCPWAFRRTTQESADASGIPRWPGHLSCLPLLGRSHFLSCFGCFSSHPRGILRASPSTTPPPTERDQVPSWT